ncbi:MAG: PIN domain-containing protein [Nocardioides sp.]
MTISVVLADANILFSRTLRDYFLYIADAGAIEIHWSQQILEEMSRNLRARLGLDHLATERLEGLMNDFIQYALIEIDPADVATAEAVEMDAKDRHVLAAALSADADILLTENTKHFPRAWMTEHGIELLGAGDLLVRLAVHFPDELRAAHARALRYSPKSEADILATLKRCAGTSSVDAIRRVTTVGSDGEQV